MEIGKNTNKDKIKLAIDVIVPHIKFIVDSTVFI